VTVFNRTTAKASAEEYGESVAATPDEAVVDAARD
jgi:hypothetical protein